MNSSAKKIVSPNKVAVLPKVFLSTSISKEVRSEIQKLYGPRPLAFVSQLALAWLVIVSIIIAAETIQTWWATAFAIFIVASRQNIFGLLVHDQAHKLGIKGRKGDIFTNIFAAYPLLVLSVENYARTHLTHHKYYFTNSDPDHHRKSGPEWTVPMKKRELVSWFLKDAFGLSILKLIKGKSAVVGSTEFQRSKPTPKFVRPVFLLLLVACLTAFNLWTLFLLYWILPIMTVLPVLVRIGALTEHIYNTPEYEIEENSPLIVPSLLNRIFMPNLNFSYHAYHHWYPAVAFGHLPKIHKIYCQHGLIDESKVFYGYLSYMKFISRQLSQNP